MDKNKILEVKGISKYFPGVQALKSVDLDIFSGEIHAVVGENGAGKSTLMKVLTGVNNYDEGEYFFEGNPVKISSIHQSIRMGVSCIYQELTVVPLIDVAKNIFLGNLPVKFNQQIDYKKLYADAQAILNRIGMNISPKTLTKDLSVAQQQMIEICKAISRNAKVIIMDEPTSSLSNKEIRVLFDVIKTLKEQNIGIFYISHKLEEITEISDRISVFRDGEKIVTFDNDETVTEEIIVRHMIGRKIENYFNKAPCEIGETVLEVKQLCRESVFENISFSVHRGEVVGFFGLVGSGRSEVMTAIFGVDTLTSGEILIDGEKVTIKNPIFAISKGLGLVPEDRKLQGLVLRGSIKDNEMMVKMNDINRFGIINEKEEHKIACEYRDYLQVKTPTLEKLVGELSGGNQQKVVIAKWLMMSPKILILDEPTRGIDVGAKSEIYKLINQLAADGVAIIVVSSELPEILGVSDRVLTMNEGKITGEFLTKDTNSQEIMQTALGR